MSLSAAASRKLSKDEVIDLLPDYQNKFVTTLTRIKIDLSDLWQDHSDLKQTLSLSQNLVLLVKMINYIDKSKNIVSLERQSWSNSQYSTREFLDISVISDKT